MTYTIGDLTISSTTPGLAQVRQGNEPSWPIRTFSGEFTEAVAERLARDEPRHRQLAANLERDTSVPFLGHKWE